MLTGNSSLRFSHSEGSKKSKDELCCRVSKPIMLGKYLECKKTLVGQFVKIKASKPDVALELCEVEVFPTRIGMFKNFNSLFAVKVLPQKINSLINLEKEP